jgi:hypothetical protein
MAYSMTSKAGAAWTGEPNDDYERRWPKIRRKILHANAGIAERVKHTGLIFSYLAENDVMSAYVGLPCPAHAEYLDDDAGFLTYFDDDTSLIGGFEFLFLAERAHKGEKIPELWLTAYAYFQLGRFTYEYPSFKFRAPPEELETLGRAVQALLPAA